METSLPQEIADTIVDEVAQEPEPVLRIVALRVCSLISRTWVHRSQHHLFSKIEFNEVGFQSWRAKIKPGEDGPSYHVRQLHFTQAFGDSYLSGLLPTVSHISSFTSLRTLHLTNVSLQHEQIRSTYGTLGSTVSHLLLEGCPMDIDHLTSFLRPFTNLEDLSLLDPRILLGPKPEYPPEPLNAKGKINLELRINMAHGGGSFVHELSLLPVAIHTITLSECNPPMIPPWVEGVDSGVTEINKLFAASRETLTHFRVHRDDFVWGIDLANVDALKELEFDVDRVHFIAHVLRTITSSRLAVITLNPNDNRRNHQGTWEQLDTVLYALVDRIQSLRGPQDGGSTLPRVKLILRSKDADCDFMESASQLLPKCVGRGCVTVVGEIIENSCAGLGFPIY